MIGKGVCRERFQPQSCSGKKVPKTGQVKGDYDNIVIIDIDSDHVDDVVIIDLPEFMQQKFHGSRAPSRGRIYPHQSVISVDDDDDDDESDDVDNHGIKTEGFGDLDSDASSSKRYCSTSSCMQNSVHLDVDDSQVHVKDFASNAQESRQTCSEKATGTNRYGLDGSEFASSESDCSDCELLEVREQWEKASFKRKRHLFNDQSCNNEHASSSGLHNNIHVDVEMENDRAEQHAGSPVHAVSNNGKYEEVNQPSFSSKGDNVAEGFHVNLEAENPLKDFDEKVDQESFKSRRSESIEEMQCLHKSSDVEHGERISEDFSLCSNSKDDNLYCGVSGATRFKKELGGKESNFMSSSQEACHRQVDNNESALRSKDDNLSELNPSCASYNESPVNCDGLVLHVQDGVLSASNESDIITDREKLKETDEYKRAMEEEWSSRHRELQIQAEEAQRLRKRKKAETQRLLDMQRRQKLRIEEVRETQKKDEEFLNMKDQLRVEIRKRLNTLEMQCSDMPSLLRGLGIHVGGGFFPLPNEVQAACKRALFKFHPDRASKTDIREQVEAEEKFKLISRMKEKFLLTSCH